jgi:hypothetical protein
MMTTRRFILILADHALELLLLLVLVVLNWWERHKN